MFQEGLFLLYLKGKRKKDLVSAWFTLQMSAIAQAGSGQNQELEHHLLSPRGSVSRKPQGLKPGSLIQDVGVR